MFTPTKTTPEVQVTSHHKPMKVSPAVLSNQTMILVILITVQPKPTSQFNRFKTELNTKLDGNHTEYEILVEDLIESVVREGSRQNMLVESLKDELIKSKCEAAENVVFESENIESKKILLDYDRIGSEVEELNIKLHESPPSKVKLTQSSLIMSVILGVTLGLCFTKSVNGFKMRIFGDTKTVALKLDNNAEFNVAKSSLD
ncbi:hypothetical protein CONCODRAFT_10205 [Conidiobolus coronatus NRRL 28638]|uniref:Uncharacterized protein n=1 Tax=Conidiobolus coronatus (strain ATCC 28846 / CBS 209.66 / NRRL 28638) TaxID=796925 RepID=A0A137NY30_CONC2|nr:hypothetical protein CONCODRAFT_10205 [Conidiobolus coronatus NRRL 28638]|eukprot:KXN67686.1 hypothetical protein CONCODRAFT_10205 [Conidiobolus coronatus NRRL 28638]